MFTIDIILGVLKKFLGSTISFLWKYKGWIFLGVIIGSLYIRGNNYKEDYQNEAVLHVKTVLEYNQQINDIRLANEKALRVAQEESEANYKALVLKTSLIQEKYNERNKDIDATINELNSSNNSLYQTIKDFTKRNTDSSTSSVSDSSCSNRLSVIGELLRETKQAEQYYATEAQKLSNSVNTLKSWSDIVIEKNKETTDE